MAHSTKTTLPSRSVRLGTTTEIGPSTIYPLSSPIMFFRPSTQLPNLSTLIKTISQPGIFHRMACSTLALHMHSPNIPLQHPSPRHGIGFGKSLPFLRSKPSFGWPVMKNFPPKPFFIIDRFFRTIPALSTTLTPKLPYTSLETALTLCPFGPTLPTLPSPTTLIATLLLTG